MQCRRLRKQFIDVILKLKKFIKFLLLLPISLNDEHLHCTILLMVAIIPLVTSLSIMLHRKVKCSFSNGNWRLSAINTNGWDMWLIYKLNIEKREILSMICSCFHFCLVKRLRISKKCNLYMICFTYLLYCYYGQPAMSLLKYISNQNHIICNLLSFISYYFNIVLLILKAIDSYIRRWY